MQYAMPQFCDTGALSYKLYQGKSQPLPAWIVFDPVSLTMEGLVPVTAQSQIDLTLVGTDSTGLSAATSFSLTFVSLPYLAKPLQNYQTRTLVAFSC